MARRIIGAFLHRFFENRTSALKCRTRMLSLSFTKADEKYLPSRYSFGLTHAASVVRQTV